MATIHPTAILDPSVILHDDVEIGPYCVVGPEVEIGAGTVLTNHVSIQALTTIGRDNIFYPYSVIGADAQDRKFRGERSTCIIGDRNQIREHVTIHRGTANGGGITRLGDDNLIMVSGHIAHDVTVGSHTTLANQVMLAGHVRIGDRANIGGGAGVHHYATIGTCAFVGGLARIKKDVPPFMVVEGHPAEVRGVNSIAMQRGGYGDEHIDAVKYAYKRLYRDNGAPISEKVTELRGTFSTVPAVLLLCDAIDAASDGVHGRALELSRADDKRQTPQIAPATTTVVTSATGVPTPH